MYDYFLGGADNFAADRDLGERLIGMVPAIPVTVRENKQFLGQAVTWAAGRGISRFIDLGAGMPTSPSTHENAQAVVPGAVAEDIDLSEPACLIMGSLLHFFAPAAATDLVARYARALAPGSYVILTMGVASGESLSP